MLTQANESVMVGTSQTEESNMQKKMFKVGVVVKSDLQWQSYLTNRCIDFNSYNSTAIGELNGHPTRFMRLIMAEKEDTSKYGFDAVIWEHNPPLSVEDQEKLLEEDDDIDTE